MPPKKRKFVDEYEKFGFTSVTTEDGIEKRQYFPSSKIFYEEDPSSSKLKLQLATFYSEHTTNVLNTMIAPKIRLFSIKRS